MLSLIGLLIAKSAHVSLYFVTFLENVLGPEVSDQFVLKEVQSHLNGIFSEYFAKKRS